ncbi:restriction endonuclease [Nostoc sp. FACHB-87]|uniref:McrC family protein n=1 Tax=Nostocaceae TaxID=1162 RepID=UPI001682593E|nr:MULTISPECIES: restriction endonuclease [Nostocaceae]MBD2455383.1 restriction endonuclease [Nostoc sp. FACHB-87]MBD2475783.1 restriction endonuclease [Anabaena sp. FACHB-83]
MSLKLIQLTEYEAQYFERNEIPEQAGIKLYEKYKTQIDVEFPTYKTRERWCLKAKGWVGYIPLTSELFVKINPKLPINNLFGMLEYAYNLKSFNFLEGQINCESLEGFYNNLAHVLSQKILERCRKGLYRTYIAKQEQLNYVRGKLNLQQVIRKPWEVKLQCNYEEHTPDIADNQILAWTLYIIGHSGFCSEKVSVIVRKAYLALQGLVTLQPYKAEDCTQRQYNRLNEDYQFLHSLCRFFLANTTPSHEKGQNAALPFIVNMDRLYEMFVAEWLKCHLPSNLRIKFQEIINIIEKIYFKTDLIIYDTANFTPKYIIDTKYKASNMPSSQDIAQVLAYAVSKNCQEVILLYPSTLTYSLNTFVGNIRVRSLTFALDDNLDIAGQIFLDELLSSN